MAPASKKGSRNPKRDRRSTSRQSTPLSAVDSAPPTPQTATPTSAAAPPPANTGVPKDTAYIHTSTAALVSNDGSIETLINGAGNNAKGGGGSDPPSARELHALHTKIKDTVNRFMAKRGEVCERSMRHLAQKRKERIAMEREQEVARAEEAARVKKEKEEEEGGSERERKRGKKGGVGKKRGFEEMEVDEEEERKERRDSLPSVGAHGLARQDGVRVNEGMLNLILFRFGHVSFDIFTSSVDKALQGLVTGCHYHSLGGIYGLIHPTCFLCILYAYRL